MADKKIGKFLRKMFEILDVSKFLLRNRNILRSSVGT